MREASEILVEVPSVADLLDTNEVVCFMECVGNPVVAHPHSPDIVELFQSQSPRPSGSRLYSRDSRQNPELDLCW